MKNHRLFKRAFFVPVLLSCFFLSLLSSCVAISPITTHWTTAKDLQPGTYTLIRYRDLAIGYLTTVAFLDLEDDPYTLVPNKADYTYMVTKGLGAGEALQLAKVFVRSEVAYNTTQISEIIDQAGNLLGYEVRPLYQPFVYGTGDVLDISYILRPENKVDIWVRMKDRIEGDRFSDDRR